jgi:hypothetical protein
MDAMSEKLHSQFSKRFVQDWSELIGPEYANALLPGRLAIIFGLPIFLISFFVMMAWIVISSSNVPLTQFTAVCVAILTPGTVLIWIGIARQLRLAMRIKRDLVAAGFPNPASMPDLRGKSWIVEWSKRRHVPLENVVHAGNAARQREANPSSD